MVIILYYIVIFYSVDTRPSTINTSSAH